MFSTLAAKNEEFRGFGSFGSAAPGVRCGGRARAGYPRSLGVRIASSLLLHVSTMALATDENF